MAIRRSDQERAGLFRRIGERIQREPALEVSIKYIVRIKMRAKGADVTNEVTGPEREHLRSLLMEVRKVDAPRSDPYLPDVLGLLLTGAADPEWQRQLREGLLKYETAQTIGEYQLQDGQGKITPRVASSGPTGSTCMTTWTRSSAWPPFPTTNGRSWWRRHGLHADANQGHSDWL